MNVHSLKSMDGQYPLPSYLLQRVVSVPYTTSSQDWSVSNTPLPSPKGVQ